MVLFNPSKQTINNIVPLMVGHLRSKPKTTLEIQIGETGPLSIPTNLDVNSQAPGSLSVFSRVPRRTFPNTDATSILGLVFIVLPVPHTPK